MKIVNEKFYNLLFMLHFLKFQGEFYTHSISQFVLAPLVVLIATGGYHTGWHVSVEDIPKRIHTPPWDAGCNESWYPVPWERWGGSNLLCLGIASEALPEETFELGLNCIQREKTPLAKAGDLTWGLVKGEDLFPEPFCSWYSSGWPEFWSGTGVPGGIVDFPPWWIFSGLCCL